MPVTGYLACLLAFVAILAGCTGTRTGPNGQHIAAFPGNRTGNIDQAHCKEPSGIVFSPGRNTLFIAGDKGGICEITRNGMLVNKTRIRGADLEGITLNPSTGLAYVIDEAKSVLLEIHPDSLKVMRVFHINRFFEGRTVIANTRHGIEGVTFVPDPVHPAGGTFHVVNQSRQPGKPNQLSAIYELDVPLQKAAGENHEATIIRSTLPGVAGLSGIHYHSRSGTLYIISDRENLLLEVALDGQILEIYDLPGTAQEGIALDNEYLYLAQDSGGIIKYRLHRTFSPVLEQSHHYN